MKSRTTRLVAAPAVTALSLAAFASGPANAGSGIEQDLRGATAAADRADVQKKAAARADADALAVDVAESPFGSRDLVSDPDYYVFDVFDDSDYDSLAVPELTGSGLGVRKDKPSAATVLGLTSSYTSGNMTYNGGSAGLLLDTNGDGATDLITITPVYTYMNLGSAYTTRIAAKQGSTWVDTGYTATWLRGSDYYGVTFDWKAAGLQNVRWTFGIIDEYDDADFSPDDYGQAIDLGAGQTPPPPPPAPPAPAPSTPAPAPTAPAPAPTTAPKPGRVSRVTKRVRKGVTVIRWGKASRATSYQVKVSRNGSRMKNFGTMTSRQVSIATKKRVKYRVSITALNGDARGSSAWITFRGK